MHVKTTSVSGFFLLRPACLAASFQASHLALARRTGADRPLAGLDRRGGEAGRGPGARNSAVRQADQGLRRDAPAQQGQFPEDSRHPCRGDALSDDRARIEAIRKAREAALADPEGRKLEQSLETHGIAPLPPRPKPVKFMRRTQNSRVA